MAYFFRWQNLPKMLNMVFSTSAGHDHDGTNSKAVTVGTIAAGALAKSAAGRAMMADDYFDAATVLAKFDADAEYLDEDMDFTFEDFEMPETFSLLAGMQ